MPRRSSRSTARATAPRASSRSTIPETVEGWANMRSESSPSESQGSALRTVKAQTWGEESPTFFCIAFEYSWIVWKSRRREFTTSAASLDFEERGACPELRFTSVRTPRATVQPPTERFYQERGSSDECFLVHKLNAGAMAGRPVKRRPTRRETSPGAPPTRGSRRRRAQSARGLHRGDTRGVGAARLGRGPL
jgi:hypothetical protein